MHLKLFIYSASQNKNSVKKKWIYHLPLCCLCYSKSICWLLLCHLVEIIQMQIVSSHNFPFRYFQKVCMNAEYEKSTFAKIRKSVHSSIHPSIHYMKPLIPFRVTEDGDGANPSWHWAMPGHTLGKWPVPGLAYRGQTTIHASIHTYGKASETD